MQQEYIITKFNKKKKFDIPINNLHGYTDMKYWIREKVSRRVCINKIVYWYLQVLCSVGYKVIWILSVTVIFALCFLTALTVFICYKDLKKFNQSDIYNLHSHLLSNLFNKCWI